MKPATKQHIDYCVVCNEEHTSGHSWDGLTFCVVCWRLNCMDATRPVTQSNLSRAVRWILKVLAEDVD